MCTQYYPFHPSVTSADRSRRSVADFTVGLHVPTTSAPSTRRRRQYRRRRSTCGGETGEYVICDTGWRSLHTATIGLDAYSRSSLTRWAFPAAVSAQWSRAAGVGRGRFGRAVMHCASPRSPSVSMYLVACAEFLEDSVEREVAKEGRACAWPPWGAEHVKSRRACFRAHADASGALGLTATGMYLLCRADVGNVPHSCLERVCRPGSAVRS